MNENVIERLDCIQLNGLSDSVEFLQTETY